MPYPLQFRPNQQCDIFDGQGNSVATNRPIQLFRPMLGLRFNRLDDDNDQHNVPGGQLHRFVLQSDYAANLLFGPPNWDSGGFPSYRLSEDPNVEDWAITDATIWTDAGGGEKLVSGFASKRRELFGTAVNAPPSVVNPDGNTPLIDYGQPYLATLPPLSRNLWRLDFRQQQGFCIIVLAQTNSAGRTIRIYGGSPIAPVLVSASAVGALVATQSILLGVPWVGFCAWVGFDNNDPAPDDIAFIVRKSVGTPNQA